MKGSYTVVAASVTEETYFSKERMFGMRREKNFWMIVALVFIAMIVWHILPRLADGLRALTPFLLAFATAYLLRHPAGLMEKLLILICGKKKHKWQHTFSSIFILILFAGLLGLLIAIIVPNIINNLTDIAVGMPTFIERTEVLLTQKLSELSDWLNIDVNTYVMNMIGSVSDMALDAVKNMGGATKLISIATGALSSAVSMTVSIVMYIVSSFFLLHDYEKIKSHIRRTLRLFIKEEDRYAWTCSLLHTSDMIVGKYIAVKLCSSFVLGVVAYVGFLLLGLPYPVLAAAVVAVTNIVPYVGPIVGAIPPILIALSFSGVQLGLWVGIFILICQQIEGNILTPLLTGDALQVSPLLVLIGIAVFGAMFGIAGMILGAPIAAIIAGVIKNAVKEKEKEIKQNAVE